MPNGTGLAPLRWSQTRGTFCGLEITDADYRLETVDCLQNGAQFLACDDSSTFEIDEKLNDCAQRRVCSAGCNGSLFGWAYNVKLHMGPTEEPRPQP